MPETLEEGLDRSANKRGLTGKERHRYIGGALRNMAKRGAITMRKRQGKPVASASAHTPARASSPAPAPATPKKAAYSAPTITKRERLELEVKQSKTHKGPDGSPRFEIFNKKTKQRYNSEVYRTRKAAQDEAKYAMERHNHPHGEHVRSGLF